eukprot:403333702
MRKYIQATSQLQQLLSVKNYKQKSFFYGQRSLNQNTRKYFSAASENIRAVENNKILDIESKTLQEEKVMSFITTEESPIAKPVLQFIQTRAALQQLYNRKPNDGFYPQIKSLEDYDQKDVEKLLTTDKTDQIGELIQNMKENSHQCSQEFILFLASNLSDKSFELCEKLYFKMKELQIEITPLVMNFLLFNVAHFGQYKHMTQLLTEATVMDTHIDLNTFLKILTTIYIENDVSFDQSELIAHLNTLLMNDHSTQNNGLVMDLLSEYLNTNSENLNKLRENMNKQRKTQKDSSAKSSVFTQPQSEASFQEQQNLNNQRVQGFNEPSAPQSQINLNDPLPDDFNDLFTKRTDLYKTQMGRSQSNLKKLNLRNRKNHQPNHTYKHLNKYQEGLLTPDVYALQNGGQFIKNGDESQLVVEIGHLRDLDHSPENIKQLSEMMADQISKLLLQEIEKLNANEEKSSRRSPKSTSNSLYKVDLTPYTKNSNAKIHPEVKDEKFTMDNFFNTIRDIKSGQKIDFFNKTPQIHQHQQHSATDKQYFTTQEELTTDGPSIQQRGNPSKNLEKTTQQNSSGSLTTDGEEEKERKQMIKDEFLDKDNSQQSIIEKRSKQSQNTTSNNSQDQKQISGDEINPNTKL